MDGQAEALLHGAGLLSHLLGGVRLRSSGRGGAHFALVAQLGVHRVRLQDGGIGLFYQCNMHTNIAILYPCYISILYPYCIHIVLRMHIITILYAQRPLVEYNPVTFCVKCNGVYAPARWRTP